MASDIARRLRRQSTEAERILWQRLRNRQLDGVKFKRQMPIGSFVVDFVALDRRLVIEVDGGQHAVKPAPDRSRTTALEAKGYRVVRFWNNEVIDNIEGVLQRLHEILEKPG